MINRRLNLCELLKSGHSAFLSGPRGVGKTVLANHFLDQVLHSVLVDLLSLESYRRYVAEPGLFRAEIEQHLQRHSASERLVVFIDEVQKMPELLDEVHYLIEKYKPWIQFLLTSSSTRKLKRTGVNLLAGRAWTLRLHPLSSQELDIDLNRALTIGTLPEYYQSENSHATRSLKTYVDTYLREEILQEAIVRRANNFVRFLDISAQVNGNPVNYSAVARDCGVSTKTAQEYFQILSDTLLAFRIDGWSHSIRKQLRQSPKFYVFDCGVLNAMAGELNSELRVGSYRYGRLFETLVVSELIRANDYSESMFRFNYWRTSTGMEVDMIMTRGFNDIPKAIEIKSSSAPKESDLKGLAAFAKENEKACLYCLCRTPREYKVGNVTVLPWQEGIEYLFQTS